MKSFEQLQKSLKFLSQVAALHFFETYAFKTSIWIYNLSFLWSTECARFKLCFLYPETYLEPSRTLKLEPESRQLF